MKIFDEIKKISLTAIITILITSILTTIVTAWIAVQDPLSELVLENVPKSIIILLPLLLLVLLVIALVYIYLIKKKDKLNLFKGLGVYWDSDYNPHCPHCKSLLSNYANYETGFNKYKPGYKCINCKVIIHLSDGSNKFLTYNEAITLIKTKLKR